MIRHADKDDSEQLAISNRLEADMNEQETNEANFTNMNATVELIDYKFSSDSENVCSGLLHNLTQFGDICHPEERHEL